MCNLHVVGAFIKTLSTKADVELKYSKSNNSFYFTDYELSLEFRGFERGYNLSKLNTTNSLFRELPKGAYRPSNI